MYVLESVFKKLGIKAQSAIVFIMVGMLIFWGFVSIKQILIGIEDNQENIEQKLLDTDFKQNEIKSELNNLAEKLNNYVVQDRINTALVCSEPLLRDTEFCIRFRERRYQ